MLKGSCLCGGVRYEIDAELQSVSYCHCSQCRKASGAAYRHRRHDSGGFISLRRGGRVDEGVGIFAWQAAMFLRAMRLADPEAK